MTYSCKECGMEWETQEQANDCCLDFIEDEGEEFD
jgi:hypothetical protein